MSKKGFSLFGGKFIYKERRIDRKKKPRFCEAHGHRARPKGYRGLPRYPKPRMPMRTNKEKALKTERCKNEPIELIEIDMHIPSLHPLNPNPPMSGKWVRIRTYEWFCRDCAAEWNYGLQTVKCKKCRSTFYSNWDEMLKGERKNGHRGRSLYCPYCRSPISEWKKVGKNKYRLYENGKPTNYYNVNGEWEEAAPKK